MSRKKVLLDKASEVNCSNLLAFEPENIFYITGFWGEAVTLLNSSGATLVVPGLEAERARRSTTGGRDCTVIESERGGDMLAPALSRLEDGNICTDCSDYSTMKSIRHELGKGRRLVPTTGPFYGARKVKDRKEIATIARASRVLDVLFAVCETELRAGRSEMEMQATLLQEGMRRGAYPPSYRYTLSPLIVASGTNSALPHAEPGGRRIRKGDLVTVDLTLRYDGYIADTTRTFAIGGIDANKKTVYEAVRESQLAGLAAIRAGADCSSVDDACRSFIRSEGYEKYFIHSTGHGIGLEVHEPPWLSSRSSEVLAKNMTVTVEPGIYIPKRYGVRIEDSVLVDRGRGKIFNRYTKDLIVI